MLRATRVLWKVVPRPLPCWEMVWTSVILHPAEVFTGGSPKKTEGIISEYEPGTKGRAYYFPARNRIISGLADLVLVVEAKEKSGSLITAACALEQGKMVYAIPGAVNDALSRGWSQADRTNRSRNCQYSPEILRG